MEKQMDDSLDILGQQPFLKIYTQICLCFTVTDAASRPTIITTLTNGLKRLSASFPWLASKVINEGAGEGSSGIFRFKPDGGDIPLVVKDYHDNPSMPSMDTLRRAGFPAGMLDESIVAPCKTIPGSSDPESVFLLQANFITGGLLLTFVGKHNTMDMTGQGQVMHLLSKACCGEEFTSEELESGNLVRHSLISLLDNSYKPGPELAQQIINPPSPSSTPPAPPKCTWAYFTFSSAALATLKAHAMETIAHPSHYISTDDALSAFIWQSVTRARMPRLSGNTTTTPETQFARAVDARPFLNTPKTYPGLLQNMTYHSYPVQRLLEDNALGAIASQFRTALDPKTSDVGYRTRALATFCSRTPDKSIISFTAAMNPPSDIMLSSWAKVNCYELDFHLGLGKPVSVRRPQFDPVESLMYLMPRSPDGEIAALLCLRDGDMERLRRDEEFVKYATYVG